MGKDTSIQWCRHSANLWWGCEEVHAGCDNCYARIFSKAKGKAAAWEGARFAVAGIWDNLRKWQRAAEKADEVHEVFCGSMMDIFEKSLPALDWNGNPLGITTGDLRDRLFRDVVPATPNLLYQFLTKRPGNATKQVPSEWLRDWPANAITGASVVDQATADTLIPQLRRVPGRRFLSMEPLLAPVDLVEWIGPDMVWAANRHWERTGHASAVDGSHHIPHSARCTECEWWLDIDRPVIHWVIVGGESGSNARPFFIEWGRDLIAQCQAAGVPVFLKQLGSNPWEREPSAWPNGFPGGDGSTELIGDGFGNYNVHGLRDSHGGDWSEWDPSLRVREMPHVVNVPSGTLF